MKRIRMRTDVHPQTREDLKRLAKKWGVRTSEALEQAVANALAEKPTDPVIRQELAEIKSLLLQVLEYGE